MKIKRYKKVNRTIRFYTLHFGFRKPYQILIDGPLCVTALKNKVNLKEQLAKYLDGDVKLLTTQCIVKETEALGLHGASKVVKQFPVHQCGHVQAVTGSDCILSMLEDGNKSRYFVATQDRELQEACRAIAGVPLIYLHVATPTLEAPSTATQDFADQLTKQICGVRPQDEETLSAFGIGVAEPAEPRRGKKRPKGPNPLSCKRKKGKPGVGNTVTPNKSAKKSHKRKKTVLEKKIRKEIMDS